MGKPLKVGVVGVGHFGRHHARVYSELEGVKLVGVADIDADAAAAAAKQHKAEAFTDYADLFGKVDAVSVAVPTSLHKEVGCAFLERGVSVLVEKPMARTAEEAVAMRECARAGGAVLQVGHIMRFNPVVQAMREMDVVPKFLEVHRLSPFSFRSTDVGVVLDMMIHDIDLVLMLVRGRLEHVDAVAYSLLSRTEDICNARLSFDDGAVANITASRMALKTLRKVRVFAPHGYISMDFVKNEGLIISKSQAFDYLDIEKVKDMPIEELKEVMSHGFFEVKQMTLEEREPLKMQLEAFVECVRTGGEPLVTADDGVRSLEAAERILEAVKAHRWYR